MSSPSKRRELDVMKLMMADHKVETVNDGLGEFFVEFNGPKESLYEGGVWRVRVQIPHAYPYEHPSIRFVNKIFHPNIDERSGSICLDVIKGSWSPMFDLLNIFEVFLPQLLLYPNPAHGYNFNAISLMMMDKKQYEEKVKARSSDTRKHFTVHTYPAKNVFTCSHCEKAGRHFTEYCERYAKKENISNSAVDEDSCEENFSDASSDDELEEHAEARA